MFNLKKILEEYTYLSNPVISPDNEKIAFVKHCYNHNENKYPDDICICSKNGNNFKRLTSADCYSNTSPIWSKDSKQIAFISTRKNGRQIWKMNIDGGEAEQITDTSCGVNRFLWSKDNSFFLFSALFNKKAKNEAEHKSLSEAKKKSKKNAVIYDNLNIKLGSSHAMDMKEFVFKLDLKTHKITKISPECTENLILQNFDLSPCGNEAVMEFEDVINLTDEQHYIYTIDLKNPDKAKRITEDKQVCTNPIYSPDGKYILYKQFPSPNMQRFELNSRTIVLYDFKDTKKILPNLSDFKSYFWAPDSSSIYIEKIEKTKQALYRYKLSTGETEKILSDYCASARHYSLGKDFSFSQNGKFMAFISSKSDVPLEIYTATTDGLSVKQITKQNYKYLRKYPVSKSEHFSFKSSDGTEIGGFFYRPQNFDPKKKYPLLLLIHGGPINV